MWAGGGDIGVKAGDTAALVFRGAQPRFAFASSSLDYSIALTKSLLGSSLNWNRYLEQPSCPNVRDVDDV